MLLLGVPEFAMFSQMLTWHVPPERLEPLTLMLLSLWLPTKCKDTIS
jgi:hypothetical protein